MKIAVTYDREEVFGHFGRTEKFKIYDADSNYINSSEVVSTEGAGHGELIGFLKKKGVDVLICGGIGGGAQAGLAAAGIRLFPGVTGSADAAVRAFLEGHLSYDPNAHCTHHGEGDGEGCGDHTCG